MKNTKPCLTLCIGVVRQIWPYDMGLIDSFTTAKRKYKATKNVATKTALREAGRKLKPFLAKLEEDIKKEDKERVVGELKVKGIVNINVDQGVAMKLKAIQHILKWIG